MTVRKAGLVSTLLLILQTGCSSATPALVAMSQDTLDPEDLFPQGMLLTVPGWTDNENKYLPAVRVSSVIIDSARRRHYRPCTGVLVHPRLVITAGHCVCIERVPTEQEQVHARAEAPKKAAKSPAALTQAAALRGVERITGIIDNKSPCATTTTVTTIVYSSQNGLKEIRNQEIPGTVMVHQQLRMVMGLRRISPGGPTGSPGKQAESTLVWNNADLAAIFLKDAVSSAFEPVQLATTDEIKLGSRVIIIGYGAGSSPHMYGERQYGENVVTRIIPLETGSVLFRTELQQLPEGGPASYAEQGDSGGACVAKVNPHLLVGFVTAGAQKQNGSYMSYFTSVYSHKDWLDQAIKRANES